MAAATAMVVLRIHPATNVRVDNANDVVDAVAPVSWF
jgi:hypothetical protein